MRPLAVLILVLGAAAALLFALTSIRDTNRRGDGPAPVVQAAEAEESSPAQLEPVVQPDVPIEEVESEPEGRAVVDVEGEAPRGAFRNWLEGTVLGPDRQPLAGAEVALLDRPASSEFATVLRVMSGGPEEPPYRRTVTDSSGYFRFTGLEPGPKWTLAAVHEEFSRKEVGPITVPQEGGVREEIVLEQGYLLHGYVRDKATGAPIAGATVALENPALIYLPSNRRPEESQRLESQTDVDGRYAIPNVTPGQRAVTCKADGYGTQIKYNINFTGKKDKQINEDFDLEQGMIIAGRVVGPDREGVEGVTVDAFGNSHDPGCRSTAVSRTGGEFVLEGLNPGFYTLRALAEGHDVDPVLRVESGATDVEIQLYEQGSVLGKVVDGSTGRPLSAFTCRVRKYNQQSPAWGAEVKRADFRGREEGTFQIGGLSEGTYVIEGQARGYASSFSEEFSITQGLTTPDIVVRMTRGGTLTGRVVDGNTGEPVAYATVSTNDNNFIQSEFTTLLQGLSQSALSRLETTTDSEGRFELELLTPETYQVSISANGYTQTVMNDVRVGDGLKTDLGIVKLSSGGSVAGTVYGPDGRPLPGCTVTMSRVDNAMWGSMRARTDANGRFQLRNATPGQYKLSASRPNEAHENPFLKILDMKNTEVLVTVAEGQDLEQDLYIKPE